MTDWKEKIIEYIEGTKDFLLENAPEFFREIVIYGRARSLLLLILCPLVFLSSIIMMYHCFKIRAFDSVSDVIPGKGAYVAFRVISIVICFISLISFLQGIGDALMCWYAPKLYIIKQIYGK